MSGKAVRPFTLSVDEAVLDDLRDRLRRTRWPERETVDDRSQGLPLALLHDLCGYWESRYDWRRCERMLNGFGQCVTALDGLDIHFLHVRSPESDAVPLLLTHGWPGSVIEFARIIGPLTDPAAHGGDRRDAFHVIAPSLPGYGFSAKPDRPGWTIDRIAAAWATLMERLGYDRYFAQGGDWGSAVTTRMAGLRPAGLAGIHLNAVPAHPLPEDLAAPTEAERQAMADWQAFQKSGGGYSAIQSTRPQTLGYGLVDSPAGLAGWIYEKFVDHMDCDGDPLSVVGYDDILDNIMLYWLPGTGASAARLYWESFAGVRDTGVIAVPAACTIFPREVVRPSRRWAERRFANIVHWNEVARGGHFAAFEQPALFVEEVRTGLRSLR